MVLYSDDIVSLKESPSDLAIVERTHQDVETHEMDLFGSDSVDMLSDGLDNAAFHRFLRTGIPPKGAVYVRTLSYPSGILIAESKLDLIDRSLLIGDVVRKEGNMSGVVINTFTTCELQPTAEVQYKQSHILRGLVPLIGLNPDFKVGVATPPILNVDAKELMSAESLSEDDIIVYKDWIGRVDTIRSNIVLMLADKCAVQIHDDLAEHFNGVVDFFLPGDIALSKKGHLRNGKWIYGSYNANTLPAGTVVETRTVTVDIAWLQRRIGCKDDKEPPQTLEREELESPHFKVYDRTRLPASQTASDPSSMISNSEPQIRLGMRVRFRDLESACRKYDGSGNMSKLAKIDRKDTLGYDLNTFDVLKFRTTVSVQWQDLSVTTEDSIGLIPDDSIDDEHMAWPAEIAHTVDLVQVPDSEEKRPSKIGVVQTVNANDRLARVQWCPNAFLERGDVGNGEIETLSAVVGTSRGEVEEISLYDIETPGKINVRRGDIVLVTNKSWLGSEPWAASGDLDWVGEIVDTMLDGRLTIRLGISAEVQDVIVNREDVLVAIRSDGTDGWDEFDEDDEDDEDEFADAMNGVEVALDGSGNLGVWHGSGSLDDEYSDGEELEEQAMYEDENGQELDQDDVEDDDWESADVDADSDVEMVTCPDEASQGTQANHVEAATPARSTPLESRSGPEPYAILDTTIPPSHHFHDSTPTSSSAHLKRTAKEHKILQTPSNLPSGVFVRTWESRLDLLRVLFVGPSETPYTNAPFIVDIYLPPQFPAEPPEAFFHSWPGEPGLGGVGRVNPNLYEDGKICLSLLGTWEGGKGEGWKATRSTLLQVVVSLLGLVLVKEPYFNEAGYEHLAGLKETERPSALYSERTYLRARSFVITALARLQDAREGQKTSVEGFEDVLKWLYCDSAGLRLIDKVIEDMDQVLRRSEAGDKETDGLTVMTKGACISLNRVLERLKQLQ